MPVASWIILGVLVWALVTGTIALFYREEKNKVAWLKSYWRVTGWELVGALILCAFVLFGAADGPPTH